MFGPSRRWAALLAGIVALCAPAAARASCAPGATPSYDDIVAVEMGRFALVGPKYPGFQLSATRRDLARAGTPRYTAAFKAIRNGPLPVGNYMTSDPHVIFDRVVSILKRHDFFALRLAPATHPYIDGPEDFVAVARCGTMTAIGSILPGSRLTLTPLFQFVDLEGPQWVAFKGLVEDLQAAVYATPWILVPKPSTSPSS